MKRIDRIRTAARNLRAGKRSTIHMVIGITVVMLFILAYILVLQVFKGYQRNSEEKKRALCYRFLNIEEGTGLDELIQRAEEGMRRIHDPSGVQASILTSIQPAGSAASKETMTSTDDMDYMQFIMYMLRRGDYYTAGNISLKMDQTTYEAETFTHWNRPRYKDIMNVNSLFRLGLYDPDFGVFPESIFSDEDETWIYGSLPEAPGDVVLDEYLLEVYNIGPISEDLIGKTLTICNKQAGRDILSDYRISGIVKNRASDLRESDEAYDLHSEHIYVYLREEDRQQFEVANGTLRYYYPSYEALTTNIDNIGAIMMGRVEWTELDDGAGMLSDVTLEVASYHWLLSQAGRFLVLLGSVAILAALSAAGYLLAFYRNRSRRFYTMLDAIGMRKQDRVRICRTEIFLILGIATLATVYLLLLFWFIFRYVIHNAMHFTPAFPAWPILVTLLLIWVIIWLLSLPFARFKPVEIGGV